MVIFLYSILAFLIDILLTASNTFLKGTTSQNVANLLLSLFTVIEFSSFAFFLSKSLKSRISTKVALFAIFIFIPVCIINWLFLPKYGANLDTIPVVSQALVIMPLCVMFYFEQIKNPVNLFIYSTPNFWVVTSILVYLSGTFFIFLYSINLSEKELVDYWSINYFFNILKNLLFGVAVYLQARGTKEEDLPFNQNLT